MLARIKPYAPAALREWQQLASDHAVSLYEEGKKKFFIAAGVGAGKTRCALSIFAKGDFEAVFIIVPKSGIRTSWKLDAQELGIDLHSVDDEFLPADGRTPHGWVMNAQMVDTKREDIRAITRFSRVLLILDEAHHMHEDGSWADDVIDAFSGAVFTVGLSGTPYRTDGNEILSLEYKNLEHHFQGEAHYTYDYETAFAAGQVAAITNRFIGGSVVKDFGTNQVEYSFDDGDYSSVEGEPSEALMQQRLSLAAVESLEWQLGAFKAAREALMKMRRKDGRKWAGLIACQTIEQATALHAAIEQAGDKAMLIAGNVDTESAVASFNADESYTWAVSITKVSEGVSIKRLRVGLLLSRVTTRTNFEQLRGRLARLVDGIAQAEQTCQFFVPADPRLIEFALSSNRILMHQIAKGKKALQDGSERDAIDVGAGVWSEDAIAAICDELGGDVKTLTTKVKAAYVVRGQAVLDGAAYDDTFYSEEEYLRQRAQLEGIISPFTLARLKLAEIGQFLKAREWLGKPKTFVTETKKVVKSVSDAEVGNAAAALFAAWHGVGRDDVVVKQEKWTFEKVRALAKGFASVSAFQRVHRGAYGYALKHGMVDEMFPERKVKWSHEKVRELAKGFASVSAFQRAHRGACEYARKHGMVDELFPERQVKWTHEKVRELAKGFASVKSFEKAHKGAYLYALKHGMVDELFPERQVKWDHEKVRELAKGFASVKSFMKAHKGAYLYALRHGLIAEMFPERRVTSEWTHEKVRELAKGFTSPNAFQRAHKGAYLYALKHGLIAEMFPERRVKSEWTNEKIRELAKGFTSPSAFKKAHGGAYNYAKRNNLLAEIKSLYGKS